MEEHQKLRRKRAIRVAITEILMFFSVVLLVIFLTLIVLGYNFNINKIGTEETVIERVGLIQVTSVPNGATVKINGESELFSRTNLSRTISAGVHKISLSRDGYDTWEKEVTITEGLLYRLSYPQLFLVKRTREEVEAIPASELRIDDEKITLEKKLEKIKENIDFGEGAIVELGEYLGENYLSIVRTDAEGKRKITVYNGNFTDLETISLESKPGTEAVEDSEVDLEGAAEIATEALNSKKPEFEMEMRKIIKSGLAKKLYEGEVGFEVKTILTKGKGELIVAAGEEKDLIFDIESEKAVTYEKEEGEGWLNEFLKFKFEDGKIVVWDFDNTNRRTLISEKVSVKTLEEGGLKLSKNNKYLYYYRIETVERTNEETGEVEEIEAEKLVREKVS